MAALFAVVMAGTVGLFTMIEARAFSYFSTRPEACANCHIMQPQLDSWQHSDHHHVATCNDCHLPSTFFAKYLAKMKNGWHHSRAFTTGNFGQPIRIGPTNAKILEENCRRCHADAIAHMNPGPRAPIACTHCHSQVGHASPAGLGPPIESYR